MLPLHLYNINDYAVHEDPLRLLDYVYQTFSDRKPIHISEWGVTHYTAFDFEKGRLTLNKDNQEITLTVNSNNALANGQQTDLNKAPIFYQNRVFVELAEVLHLSSEKFLLF